ncbi:hypothetical protein [Amycolatopsis samaneae]|uniref:Uncharacterized protein n=1 Tax=Amycolatopsis samaneae TaxID=664691 RepID=A0ABW5G895_9PSEU
MGRDVPSPGTNWNAGVVLPTTNVGGAVVEDQLRVKTVEQPPGVPAQPPQVPEPEPEEDR